MSETPSVDIPEGELPDEDREPLTPTEEEIEDGNHLGSTIDVDDDEDSGARESYL